MAPRLGSSVFIALYLAAMIALPVSYYVGSDPFDERFAWRMFSSVRTLRCEISVHERVAQTHELRAIDPRKLISATWVRYLLRADPTVAARFLDSRCSDEVDRVSMSRVCETIDRRKGPTSRWTKDCATGEIIREGVGANR